MGNNVEYVWVRPFTRDGEDFKGRLVNDARMRPDLKYGQTIAFDETNIAEWSYLDNTGMRGNATACALVATSPQDQRQTFTQQYGLTCD